MDADEKYPRKGLMSMDELVVELRKNPEYVEEETRMYLRFRLGLAVAVARTQLNLTQREAAKRCCVSLTTLNLIEQYQIDPRLDTVNRICQGLNIHVTMDPDNKKTE